MKLQKVLAMYSNRSTSNHTHGLVPCTQDFILHNPIDEHLNLQQTMSEPAINNVRLIQYRVIPSHQTPSHVHCLFPKDLQQTRTTCCTTECMCMHDLFKVRTHGHATVTIVTYMCALVNGTFELPFNLSF
jgi:hypothetical protein